MWQEVYEKKIDSFYCVSTPEYDADTIRASKNNDYSAYKLRPTDETKKVIALMNKYLFSGEDKGMLKPPIFYRLPTDLPVRL